MGNSELELVSIAEGERDYIIYGPASVERKDKAGDIITGDALDQTVPQLLRRGRFSLNHEDVIAGEIMPMFKDSKGRIWKTEVRKPNETDLRMFKYLKPNDKALFVVGNVYGDTEIAQKAREQIEKGELKSFSISGYSPKGLGHVKDAIELEAVTLCASGMNPYAKFEAIAKSDTGIRRIDRIMLLDDERYRKYVGILDDFMQADELVSKQERVEKPFAGYNDFEDCVKQNQDKSNPGAYCGYLKNKIEKINGGNTMDDVKKEVPEPKKEPEEEEKPEPVKQEEKKQDEKPEEKPKEEKKPEEKPKEEKTEKAELPPAPAQPAPPAAPQPPAPTQTTPAQIVAQQLDAAITALTKAKEALTAPAAVTKTNPVESKGLGDAPEPVRKSEKVEKAVTPHPTDDANPTPNFTDGESTEDLRMSRIVKEADPAKRRELFGKLKERIRR